MVSFFALYVGSKEAKKNGILALQGLFRNFNYLGKNSENWCYLRKLIGIEMFN